MEKSELAKTIVTGIAPIISAITETFFKPKIKELAESLTIKKKNFEHILESKFNQYLLDSYEKNAIINTIVFHNQQKLLKDLYMPLVVENLKNETFEINDFPKILIENNVRTLITDTAGMGKSTLLKKIFLSIIDEKVGIPILIELRRLSKTKDVIDEILEQLTKITEIPDKSFVLHLIQKGDFYFLFDGFDEIPLDERKSVTKQIQTFINKANNNYFVLTSRPEAALSSFGDFKEYKIKPLKKEQAFELLSKYDSEGLLSKQLIRKLRDPQYKNIEEFLSNPLLVSLLFAAYEHKQTIPLKKHIFYRQVYDALFENHDLTKGDSFVRDKFSNLDVDEFHRVLRHIGYNCIIKGKIEFTKDEILNLIREAKDFTSGLTFKESDLLKDIINTVPLFTIDGIYFKWSHKSLQEYFAAQFIFLDAKEKQKTILFKFYKRKDSDRFFNLLDIYYSIDYKSFSEVITYNLLKDYFEYMKSSYKGISLVEKKERQLITFAYNYLLIKVKLGADKSTKIIWTKMKEECPEIKNWSLLIAPVPNEEKINYIKVPVSPKFTSRILSFLHRKKVKFVKKYQRKIETDSFIELKEETPYLVTEDLKSILNTKENFKKVNDIILQYNKRELLIIDELEGRKAFKKIQDSMGDANDKLLDF